VSRRFLQVWVKPDPTLLLPLQHQQRTLNFKLFHALPIAQIWHLVTSGWLQLSRNISKDLISHVMTKLKLLWENNSKTSWRVLDWQVWLIQHWQYCFKEEIVEKWGIETKYTFWAIFCVLFPFDTLPGSKDIGITFQITFIYSLCENLKIILHSCTKKIPDENNIIHYH
jgi:hypothetical protein